MRIVCPNCGAEYEVPDEVIPETGRDVQCSNCGETWFQAHPSNPQATEPTHKTAPDSPEDADWTEPEDTPDDIDDAQRDEPAPRRQRLDPDVASVLREEAEREARARATDGGAGLETQPDLGLAAGEEETRSRQTRERMERLRGAAQEDMTAEKTSVSRRDFLPDIKDFNPAITSEKGARGTDMSARDGSAATVPDTARPSGFRRGMRLAILLAIIATAIYIFAPQIAAFVPAATDPLTAYVAAVDRIRAALHEGVGVILQQIRGLIGG